MTPATGAKAGKRDPRWNPKGDDQLRMPDVNGLERVEVVWGATDYPPFEVGYRFPDDAVTPNKIFRIDILLWREWAKNAEVIHAAE